MVIRKKCRRNCPALPICCNYEIKNSFNLWITAGMGHKQSKHLDCGDKFGTCLPCHEKGHRHDMKQTTLIHHLSTPELYRRYRNCKNVQEARRWHILWLISTHMPVTTVASTTGMSRTWIWHICTRYNAMGPAGVRRQQSGKAGAHSLLSAAQFRQLQQAVSQPAPDGGRWTSQKVAEWIANATNRPHVATRTGWVYLCKCRGKTAPTMSFGQ